MDKREAVSKYSNEAGDDLKVIQIVGYKNSGKTTTIAACLRHFKASGTRVASFKHHGHGGVPDGLENKDSMKHQEAGAVIAGVTGEGLLQFTREESWELEEVIPIYEALGIEVLFVEGFKRESYPKVVLIPEEKDKALLEELTEIIAVVSNLKIETNVPIFNRDELLELCHWIYE